MTAGGRMVRQHCRGTWRTTAALVALTLMALAGISGGAAAQTITVSSSPGTLHVTTAIAGGTPVMVTETSTTYHVTIPNSGGARKITAKLASPLPAGVTMTIVCAAPGGASSAGTITLSTTAQDVVTSIAKKTDVAGLSITYTLTAALSAGVVASQTRNVTLTVTP